MPKLIDYPRTNYTGAWEIAEVVDDTGGKCALETSARKLNRKVSGSFKAIIGSAVKFGLLTSKREMLTTTTLFRRIKHAYDKQEELLFHREAFLTPPLFTQLCRKFRGRELPVAMLDVLLIREFDVEEINAQSVAKAFTDGARMVGLLNEHNVVADIDQLAAQQPPRREIASPMPSPNVFRQSPTPAVPTADSAELVDEDEPDEPLEVDATLPRPTDAPKQAPSPDSPSKISNLTSLLSPRPTPAATTDAIANLFGLGTTSTKDVSSGSPNDSVPLAIQQPRDSTPSGDANSRRNSPPTTTRPATQQLPTPQLSPRQTAPEPEKLLFHIQLAGPGINTQLEVADVEDLALIRALLDKIERRLKQ